MVIWFYCAQKSERGSGDDPGFELTFYPVVDGSAENKDFFKWTPAGQIVFSTINAKAAEQFEQGKEYYVDFSPAG